MDKNGLSPNIHHPFLAVCYFRNRNLYCCCVTIKYIFVKLLMTDPGVIYLCLGNPKRKFSHSEIKERTITLQLVGYFGTKWIRDFETNLDENVYFFGIQVIKGAHVIKTRRMNKTIKCRFKKYKEYKINWLHKTHIKLIIYSK